MIYEDFLAQFTDWRPQTMYWQRFSIADKYGKDEIKEVYDELFRKSKKDYKLLTELVMVLNHKSWEHNEYQRDDGICELYTRLFNNTNDYALNNLKDNELSYYLEVTD